MPRVMEAGLTDYSHQTLPDIVSDLRNWLVDLKQTQTVLDDTISSLVERNYWQGVYIGMKDALNYSRKLFATSIQEIEAILAEIETKVKPHHVLRLRKLGQAAYGLNSDLGRMWHREYPDHQKDYNNPDFRTVDHLYAQTRDMAADMLDLTNAAGRLSDFVGTAVSKSSVAHILNNIVDLRPNLFGIGLNINNLLKRILRSK